VIDADARVARAANGREEQGAPAEGSPGLVGRLRGRLGERGGRPAGRGVVQVDDVSRRFGEVTALDAVSLAVEQGEFLTLLGPSGCGKTTLLRCVAGFDRPDEGRILLGGRDITRQPPNRRPVNMVFQRPTLFPHLDVFGNVAFGLRMERLARGEIVARVGEALSLVHLEGLERRRATELSGGQMQRVSLARALVKQPAVLLLDEPLSALDLKIRLEMEVELRRVHRETGATFIYVTHDQREALALSDRIAVLDHGRIEQLGTPEDVYREPSSAFAARFVGNANVLPAELGPSDGETATVRVAGVELAATAPALPRPGPVWIVVRAETIDLGAPPAGTGAALGGTVVDVAFRGTGYSYRLQVDGLPVLLTVETHGSRQASVGERVSVAWGWASARILPREDG
jgi:ABC-type Fe3+/spermidine/putrescine transport system ATPase subunit